MGIGRPGRVHLYPLGVRAGVDLLGRVAQVLREDVSQGTGGEACVVKVWGGERRVQGA